MCGVEPQHFVLPAYVRTMVVNHWPAIHERDNSTVDSGGSEVVAINEPPLSPTSLDISVQLILYYILAFFMPIACEQKRVIKNRIIIDVFLFLFFFFLLTR